VTDKTGWQPEETGVADEPDMPPASTDGNNGEESAAADFAADEDLSTPQILRLLVSEGRDYAAHEIQRQKLRAAILGTAARDAAILVLVSLFLLMGALIAGLIGIIMGLAPLVGGPLAATGIVIAASFLLILLFLLVAQVRVKRALRLSFPPQERSL